MSLLILWGTGTRCGAHNGVLTAAAEGTSSYTNFHISTTTATRLDKMQTWEAVENNYFVVSEASPISF